MIGLSALHERAPEVSITFSDIENLIESQLFEINVSLISMHLLVWFRTLILPLANPSAGCKNAL